MIENKCVQTLEPEQELAKSNALGWRLITAISQFAGILLFFEREVVPTVPVSLTKESKESLAKLVDAQATQPKGKRK